MNDDQLKGIIRHGLTAGGVAGATLTTDHLVQLLSAVATILGFIWSFYEKRNRPPSGGAPAGTPPAGGLAALLVGMLLLGLGVTGCTTTGPTSTFVAGVITPARIESVTALGAYFAGKAAIVKGHRAELQQALNGLKSMQGSSTADLVAVAAALEAAGLPQVASDEGMLVLGAVTSFQDLWSHTAQPILDDERARAVLAGLVRGLDMALTAPETREVDPVQKVLVDAARATR